MRSGSTLTGRAGAAFRQKTPVQPSQAETHRGVRDLELAQDRVVLRQPDLPEREIGAGRDDDLRLPRVVDVDERDPGGLVGDRELELHVHRAQLRERLVGERIASDGPDQRHVRTESGARDGLVRALAARNAGELRAADRLSRPRQPRAPSDEIEVDRPDDRDARRSHHASG